MDDAPRFAGARLVFRGPVSRADPEVDPISEGARCVEGRVAVIIRAVSENVARWRKDLEALASWARDRPDPKT